MKTRSLDTSGERLAHSEAEKLWRAWKHRGDAAARDRLILSYAPMVHYLASRKARVIPAHCDVDDLVSCGLMALVGAVDRFDPHRGATFEQFAWTRVSGAIADDLRRQDWAPRSVRRMQRETERSRERLQTRSNRQPSEAELAADLGVDVGELRQRLVELERASVVSLSQKVRAGEADASELGETIESGQLDTSPELALLAGERSAFVAATIAAMPEREREVLTLVHIHNLAGAEIGRRYGVSESRVSQILASARKRLGVALATYDESRAPAA